MCTDISKSQQQVMFRKKAENTHKSYVRFFLFRGQQVENEKRILYTLPLVLYSTFSCLCIGKQAATLNYGASLSTDRFFKEARKRKTQKEVHKSFLSDSVASERLLL